MDALETATYGAKVQSWRAANPRDLLKRLIDQNPGLQKPALLKLLRDELRGDDAEDYLDSIIEYWFANNYHSLTERPAVDRAAAATARRQRVEAVKERVKERIREEAQMILLDMVLPNGKALRDCTGRECATLGAKVGSWLTKVSRAVKPNQIVGEALDEAAVRRLYGR